MAATEFGGFLPLELSRGHELYSESDQWSLRRFNSGRTAMRCAFETLQAKRIFYPSYYCPSTTASIRSLGIEAVPYAIGYDLLPESLDFGLDEGDVVVLVDYFGICTERIPALVDSFERVVVDDCHSFFTPPILREGVVTVYSCRKFLGVGDGAYAISSMKLGGCDWPEDYSAPRMSHVVGSVERGTNAYYEESIRNKEGLDQPRTMSKLTRRILDSVDYAAVQKQRSENFRVLDELLGDLQELPLPDSTPQSPWCYPLLTGKMLRQGLVSQHVYIPRIWETWVGIDSEDMPEYLFSNYLACVPIDQRYSSEDMVHLARIIHEEWGK